MRRLLAALLLFLALLAQGPTAGAAQDPAAASAPPAAAPDPGAALEAAALETPAGDETAPAAERLSTAVEIALMLALLSLLPAALISVTCFTRIVIVLSFVRRSLSVNELPPNPIIIGLALFLTSFVMAPVATRMYREAYVPYKAHELGGEDALKTGWGELRGFLLANTREGELKLFAELAKIEPADDGGVVAIEDLPFQVVVPAFVLSELKTAFQMGFLLFLPFLVIDLVIASVLISMGMFMLPPVMISTPFKILIFILVDGWHLVCESLVTSFTIS